MLLLLAYYVVLLFHVLWRIRLLAEGKASRFHPFKKLILMTNPILIFDLIITHWTNAQVANIISKGNLVSNYLLKGGPVYYAHADLSLKIRFFTFW